ncbi:MAG: alpha/beta fold hydrolase [Rhodospirillaceae bacterium]|nr:alpha/beta fold hydrolase [Rhodospirillaceae bacterium]
MSHVKRAFADLDEGQVHYWISSAQIQNSTPLVVLHPGPGTARIQLPLLEALSKTRTVIAPDIMGMGDSSAPPHDESNPPEIPYYADAVLRFLDTLGVDNFDLYGSSLGGRVSMDIAVSHPKRLRRLMLGQVKIMHGQSHVDMANQHAPKVTPDQSGVYVQFLWSRLRDLYTYFPWFKRKVKNMRKTSLPSAGLMHIAFIEQIKMAATAHLAFAAYYRYPVEDKLPRIKAKTMVCGEDALALIPDATEWIPAMTRDPLTATAKEVSDYAAQIEDFLDN